MHNENVTEENTKDQRIVDDWDPIFGEDRIATNENRMEFVGTPEFDNEVGLYYVVDKDGERSYRKHGWAFYFCDKDGNMVYNKVSPEVEVIY